MKLLLLLLLQFHGLTRPPPVTLRGKLWPHQRQRLPCSTVLLLPKVARLEWSNLKRLIHKSPAAPRTPSKVVRREQSPPRAADMLRFRAALCRPKAAALACDREETDDQLPYTK